MESPEENLAGQYTRMDGSKPSYAQQKTGHTIVDYVDTAHIRPLRSRGEVEK